MAKVLTDNDICPFGKHKGERMIDIPASYLLWYAENGPEGNVKDYAIANKQVLIQESKTNKDTRFEKKYPKGQSYKKEEKSSPKPISAEEFTKRYFGIPELLPELTIDLTAVQLAQFLEDYQNFLYGSYKLKELPKKEEKNKEEMMGWGEDSSTISSDDIPF